MRDAWRPGEGRRLLRYGIVGLAINGVGYACYLALVWLGLSPMGAVTVLYPVALAAGLVANRRWTFEHRGSLRRAVPRFLLAHLLGYLLNLGLLRVFVHELGFPHAIVQAVAIFVVAGYLFVALRLFVFAPPRSVPPLQ